MADKELERYHLGFVCGRFQMFHNGHRSIIEYSLAHAEKTVILIGSSDKMRTESNPFTFEERKEMIQGVYPEAIILSLPDIGVGNVPAWGEYMMSTIEKNLGQTPDLYVSGSEAKIDTWFSPERLSQLTIHKVDREEIPVSATMLREMALHSDFDTWCQYVPLSMHSSFEQYHRILADIGRN